MLTKIPKDCPSCGGSVYVVKEHDLETTNIVKCRNCDWSDKIETTVGTVAKVGRTVGVGALVVTGLLALIDEITKSQNK